MRFCSSLCTCIYRMQSKRPANITQAMQSASKQRVCAPLSFMPTTLHRGVRGGVAEALPVNLEYVTVFIYNKKKKLKKRVWGA